MDRLPAPRNTMPIIVSSYQHCYEQQFQTLLCALYAFLFSVILLDLVIQALLVDYILALEKNVHASSGSCFHIEINILSIFKTKYTTKSTSVS